MRVPGPSVRAKQVGSRGKELLRSKASATSCQWELAIASARACETSRVTEGPRRAESGLAPAQQPTQKPCGGTRRSWWRWRAPHPQQTGTGSLHMQHGGSRIKGDFGVTPATQLPQFHAVLLYAVGLIWRGYYPSLAARRRRVGHSRRRPFVRHCAEVGACSTMPANPARGGWM